MVRARFVASLQVRADKGKAAEEVDEAIERYAEW
jgi:hypothetical protein